MDRWKHFCEARKRKTGRKSDPAKSAICALPLEASMVRAVFDKVWSDEGFDLGQAEEDRNAYTIGVIGKHNVVLIHGAGMGATDATTAVIGLRSTFPNINTLFVVGICGASPMNRTTQEEIYLGDCIFSTALIQYDFGRQYPGHFDRKTGCVIKNCIQLKAISVLDTKLEDNNIS